MSEPSLAEQFLVLLAGDRPVADYEELPSSQRTRMSLCCASVMRMNEIRVRPKLAVDGADRAIEFYRDVLGATLRSRHVMGEAVVFAELELPGGDVLQVKDADEFDRAPGPDGAGVIVDVLCADPDAIVATALERGAVVIFEVADQPYGTRQGRFRDPFGHQWIVGTELTKSDEEIQAALDEWSAEGSAG